MKDSNNQNLLRRYYFIQNDVPVGEVAHNTRCNLVIYFSLFRFAGNFLTGLKQKRVVLVGLTFRPCVVSIFPNDREIFDGFIGK